MRITVSLKPNSTKGPLIERQEDGSLIIYVRERAVDGNANEALIQALATHYRVPKTTIRIIRGTTSRRKVVEVPQKSEV